MENQGTNEKVSSLREDERIEEEINRMKELVHRKRNQKSNGLGQVKN